MAIITKNSRHVDPGKIFIPIDLWRTIIEYLNDDVCGTFNSIVKYRAINKAFGDVILGCIKELRINVLTKAKSDNIPKILDILLSRPLSLRKLVIRLKFAINDK
jgi:hypothetical protein